MMTHRMLAVWGAALIGMGAVAAVVLGEGGRGATGRQESADADSIRHGRYLVQIGGCNDCHTPGYALKKGNVSEDKWLIGDGVGFNGPWGTTYPTNLRRYMRMISADEWVRMARTLEARPPMPWFNIRVMNERDLRAVYAYVRSLAPDDSPVPDYVPPDGKPTTPFFVFVPRQPD